MSLRDDFNAKYGFDKTSNTDIQTNTEASRENFNAKYGFDDSGRQAQVEEEKRRREEEEKKKREEEERKRREEERMRASEESISIDEDKGLIVRANQEPTLIEEEQGTSWEDRTFKEKVKATIVEMHQNPLVKQSEAYQEGLIGDAAQEDIPFYGTVKETIDLVKIGDAYKDVSRGEGTDVQKEMLRDFYAIEDELMEKRQDIGYQAGEIIRTSAKFMGELVPVALTEFFSGSIAPTGEAYVGTKLAQKGALKLTKEILKDKMVRDKVMSSVKEVGKKNLKTFGKQMLVSGSVNIPHGTAERMIGRVDVDTGEILEEGQEIGEAIVNSTTGLAVELASELGGGVTGKALGTLTKPAQKVLVKSSIFNALKKKLPKATESQLTQVLKKAGWNGVIGEFFEERDADILNNILHDVGLGDQDFTGLTVRDMVVEFLAFGSMGTGIKMIEKGVGKLQSKPDSDELVRQELANKDYKSAKQNLQGVSLEEMRTIKSDMDEIKDVDASKFVMEQMNKRAKTVDTQTKKVLKSGDIETIKEEEPQIRKDVIQNIETIAPNNEEAQEVLPTIEKARETQADTTKQIQALEVEQKKGGINKKGIARQIETLGKQADVVYDVPEGDYVTKEEQAQAEKIVAAKQEEQEVKKAEKEPEKKLTPEETKKYETAKEIDQKKVSERTPNELMAGEHGANVWMELDASEAKKTLFQDEDVDSKEKGVKFTKQPSTFPQWISKDLRERKLFDKVQEHMREGTEPTTAKAKRLYDEIVDEVRSREQKQEDTGVKYQRSPKYYQARETIVRLQQEMAKVPESNKKKRKMLLKNIEKLQEEQSKYQTKEEPQSLEEFTTSKVAEEQLKQFAFVKDGITIEEVKSIAGGQAYGSYSPLQAMVRYVKDPLNTTIPHEMFHAFFDAVATEKQQTEALDMVKKTYPQEVVKKQKQEDLSLDVAAEEILAEKFADMFVSKKQPKTKLGRFLRWLGGQMKAMVKQSTEIEKLYNQVLSPFNVTQAQERIQKELKRRGLSVVPETYQRAVAQYANLQQFIDYIDNQISQEISQENYEEVEALQQQKENSLQFIYQPINDDVNNIDIEFESTCVDCEGGAEFVDNQLDKAIEVSKDGEWAEKIAPEWSERLEDLDTTLYLTDEYLIFQESGIENFYKLKNAPEAILPVEMYQTKQLSETDPLIEKARKYKTADEFVKAKKLSQKEMLSRGADGYLGEAYEMEIPLSKIDGREPAPAMEGGYKKGTEIKQPVEVQYQPETNKYILYAGNHRVTQAEINGQKTIKAFVEDNSIKTKSQLEAIWNEAQYQKFQKKATTDTPEFKNWFGDSKVVDANGDPLVVYHGTQEEFTVFDASLSSASSSSSINAIYFSPNKGLAEQYSGYDGIVMETYLRINNPYIIDANGQDFNSAYNEIEHTIRTAKQEKKYDGAVIKNLDDSLSLDDRIVSDTYVVFNPNQIKSVDNTGAFSTDLDDIRYQKKTMEKAEKIVKAGEKKTIPQRATQIANMRMEIAHLKSKGDTVRAEQMEKELQSILPPMTDDDRVLIRAHEILHAKKMEKRYKEYQERQRAEKKRARKVDQKKVDMFIAKERKIRTKLRENKNTKIEKLEAELAVSKYRRELIEEIADRFGLSDPVVRKVMKDKEGNTRDVRNMSDKGFESFTKGLIRRGLIEQRLYEKRADIVKEIEDKRIRKIKNLQKALKLPKLQNMSLTQLTTFENAIAELEDGDVMLTQRQLETLKNTDMFKARTMREVRMQFAQEANIDYNPEMRLTAKGVERFLYDTRLSEKHPFYKMMVEQTTRELLRTESDYISVEHKTNELIKAARKSRKRSMVDRLIPTDDLIFEYLEADNETRPAVSMEMTPEEMEAALYIQGQFAQYRAQLLLDKMMKRSVANYMTHIRKGFLEGWKQMGFIDALKTIVLNVEKQTTFAQMRLWTPAGLHNMIKGVFSQVAEDQAAFEIIADTGEILPLEKFFQFSMRRTGNLDATKDVGKAFLEYSKTYHRKRGLDAVMPKLDAYVTTLAPEQQTERGLQMDRSLKTFYNEWMNTKKGRKHNMGGLLKQGHTADNVLRVLRMTTTLLDLGWALPVGLASNVGEQYSNIVGLGFGKWALGSKRMVTKQGREIVKKYENFVGKSFWDEMADVSNTLGQKVQASAFSLFGFAARRANEQYLLASMTKEEFQVGEVSDARLSEIRNQMGKFRVVEGANSIAGATSAGKIIMQYKGWAVPHLQTTVANLKAIIADPKKLKQQEGQEVLREAILSSAFLLFMMYMMDEPSDDDDIVTKMGRTMVREGMALFGALDHRMWIALPRTVKFVSDLAVTMEQLLKLEEYKASKRGEYSEGDLKWPKKLERTVKPKVIKQFE